MELVRLHSKESEQQDRKKHKVLPVAGKAEWERKRIKEYKNL